MAISIHFTHVGSYLYCMIWYHLGILSILLHHYVVYFRFLSGSVSPFHTSLNMMSMNSKRPKCNQLKNDSATSSVKIVFIFPSPGCAGQSSVLQDVEEIGDPEHSRGVLERVLVPPPHVFEQDPHELQSFQVQ